MNKIPSRKIYLISGVFLFLIGIIDMLTHEFKSYILILSFFPLTYFFIYNDLKRDDERFKFIKNRAGFFTFIFSLVYLLILYLINYFSVSNYQIEDLIFLIFAGIIIFFNVTLIILKNIK